MVKRQVFFSFHFDNDNWRAALVKNMGKVSNESTFSANDWEEVKKNSEDKIKQWIDDQLQKRSCLVVLIGYKTAKRKWINYEIQKAYELDKGIVGIYINKLKNQGEIQDPEGDNPFDYLNHSGVPMSKYIKCFKSHYKCSKEVYANIEDNIQDLIEYGIENKPSTW
jgi:hypothetical protein